LPDTFVSIRAHSWSKTPLKRTRLLVFPALLHNPRSAPGLTPPASLWQDPGMSLVPLLTKVSKRSGCADAMRCEAVLAEAAARRVPLVDALYAASLVDEESFARQLAEEAGLECQAESELDLTSALHRRFPAKLALRHRLLPARIDEEGIRLMTYDPFDLEARQ